MSSEKLNTAISAIKSGDKATGSRLLNEILKDEPKNELAWIWLATCLDDVNMKVNCLKKVISINPNNQLVLKALSKLEQPSQPTVDEIIYHQKEIQSSSKQYTTNLDTSQAIAPIAASIFDSNQTSTPTKASQSDESHSTLLKKDKQTKVPQKASRLEMTLGLIFVILFIVFVVFILSRSGKSTGISAEFKSNLNSFLVEAGKLNVMTEQGVSYMDFKNQLVEVKSTYSILDDSWPSSLDSEKQLFDKAVDGWDITFQVWKYGIDNPSSMGIDHIVVPNPLATKATEYTGYQYASVGWFIGPLMEVAGKYYEAGVEGVNNKIK